MSMIIAHNNMAINTQKNLGIAGAGLSKSMEKLSSGYRINVGADGPADLVISEQLRAQLSGMQRAVRNTSDAYNVMAIAEGALNEMNNILKKMKQLAIHSASTGVTSASQVAADQAEMDSAIQTIDKIANTTKFSDQQLLNGNKQIVYSRSTEVKSTQNNSLLNTGTTKFDQVFRLSNYQVAINYTGAAGATTNGVGETVDYSKQATKAYMEIDTVSHDQVNTDGTLTQSQQFILTGSKGARNFTFNKGANITDVVSQIHASADSTGVDAALVFASNQAIVPLNAANATIAGGTNAAAGAMVAFGNDYKADGTVLNGINAITAPAGGIVYGKNTDGQGRIYVKVLDTAGNYELYKDESMTEASKVGYGKSGTAATEYNDSGLTGLNIALTTTAETVGMRGLYVSTAGINNAAAANGLTVSGDVGTTAGMVKDATTLVTGVELGTNTDSAGKIYTKIVSDGTNIQAFAYKDQRMREEDLVAKSDQIAKASTQLYLNEVRNSDDTAGTGLGMTLQLAAAFANAAGTTAESKATLQFTNLAARIYSQEYGSNQKIQVQQISGGLFSYYDKPDDVKSARLVDAGTEGVTVAVYGQDASLSVNGQLVKTTGLDLNMATQDLQARMRFNEGVVGSTTLAQVGYGTGSIFSSIGALQTGTRDTANSNGITAYLCNAGHNTTEKVGNFTGGMVVQLGEGSGDQERTVLSIQSMAIANMGQVTKGGYWETGSAVYSEKTFTMQDMFGGGQASLASRPTLAMEIIEQAINDVSDQRARLGSFQSNMLQTNINNLTVSIENIQKTESTIRDTDMATEMTDYTKNQVLQNAAMSMLAQANAQSQAALQLLG